MRTGPISQHFNWKETAVSLSHPSLIEAVPPEYEENAIQLATTVLQPIRDRIGTAMVILSWYRSVPLNIAVGGSNTSQHRTASAADFRCSNLRKVFEELLQYKYVQCGQTIFYPEARFIHIAIPNERYPEPSFHVHVPEHGISYRKVRSVAELAALVKTNTNAAPAA